MIAAVAQGSVTDIPSWAFPAVIIGIIATFAWNSIMSLVLFRITKGDRDVESLKSNLQTSHTKLLDERDRRISQQLANHALQVTAAMDLTAKHAEMFDARLRELSETAPKLQMELVRALADSREFVRINAADKIEFREFCEEARKGREEMIQAVAKLERQVVTTEDLKQIIQEIRRGA